MEVDARMLLTIAGMLASIVAAFIIVKTKLQAVIEEIGDFEARIRALDKSTDAQEISITGSTRPTTKGNRYENFTYIFHSGGG